METTALPISIFNSTFQSFTDNVATAKPDQELLTQVHKFMVESTKVGPEEALLAENLRDFLTKILGRHMPRVTTPGAPDGLIVKVVAGVPVPLVIMEYKRAIDEGGSDPMLRASHSTWKIWRQTEVRAVNFKTLLF
jgi:hypothetical protein